MKASLFTTYLGTCYFRTPLQHFFLLLYKTMNQGITKICLLSWLANSALVYEPKCGGGGGGGCGFSANEYISAHGAQINFGDLTPYLTYSCDYSLFSTIYILDFHLKKLSLYSRCGGSTEMRSGRNRRHFSPQETKPNLSLSLYVEFFSMSSRLFLKLISLISFLSLIGYH
jgi:hypothetical protein